MEQFLATLRDEVRNLNFRTEFLDANLRSVTRACRDSQALALARDLVPLGELLQGSDHILDDEPNYKDKLLPLVVDWFSNQFFTWFQPPDCVECSAQACHKVSSVNEEGKLVEYYACDNDTCEFTYNFIRHDEPAILLHTRTGRCGEWALCFLTVLQALDYDSRVVFDSTDHVWNEVWSDSKQRWVHVDPCESVIDAPLMYEIGWSKSPKYCIAMSRYEVTDVTRRYVTNFEDTKRRRTSCNESWLAACLDAMTVELLKLAPSAETIERVRRMRRADIQHLEALSTCSRRIPDKSEFAGRRTGSLRWRMSRGEFKPSGASKFVIKVDRSQGAASDAPEAGPLFGLHYNSDGNVYRSTCAQFDSVRGWHSLAYGYENLDFKYERDWKVSYVARYENCAHDKRGSVRWRFDLAEAEDWRTLRLHCSCQVYPNTSVRLHLESHATEHSIEALESREVTPNQMVDLDRQELHAETKFIDLVALLEGGESQDEVAWQKPQLFRQARGDQTKGPSALLVEFY